ncbi:hypothetical protein pb186bvf_015037 [Paramecium bursaria]
MPLLIICGRPGSGKTKRAQEIANYIQTNFQKECIIVNEENSKIIRNEGYKDPNNEKQTRGFLRSSVEKYVQSHIVIFDSMNYIKGFRYEIFCLARAAKTTYCVLYCNSPYEVCVEYNKQREDQFSIELFEDLFKRMEVPNQLNKWDSPYFEVRYNEPTPLEEISETLLVMKNKSKDPVATKQEKLHEGNFVHEQDKRIQEIFEHISKNQLDDIQNRNGVMKFPGSQCTIRMYKPLSQIEIKKLRLEFLNLIRVNPINNINLVHDALINFLQGQLDRLQ